MREHLDRAEGDDGDLVDVDGCVAAMDGAADALDAWYRDGRRGERPAGRLRRHEPAPVGTVNRWWATPIYKWLHDPDGRPLRLRIRARGARRR